MGPGMFDGIEKAFVGFFCLVFAAGAVAALAFMPLIRFISSHVSIH